VLWELTGLCNLNCRHCHRTTFSDAGMPTRAVLETIDALCCAGVENIIFSGGEPLLRADIYEILRYAKDMIGDIDLCTNGIALDSDAAHTLHVLLGEISITLNATRALHDWLCGLPGAFARTLQGVRIAVAAGLEVHLIAVVWKGIQESEIENLVVLAMGELGVHSISLLRLLPFGRGAGLVKAMPDFEDRVRFETYVRKLRERYPSFPINTKRLVNMAPLGQCPAGRHLLAIDTDGTIRSCPLLGDRLGTISSIAQIELKGIRGHGASCGACSALHRCAGGCPAEGKPDVLCTQADPHGA